MKPILIRLVAVAAVVAASGCAHNRDLRKPQAQDNFGVQMAKMNLWREAMFRFQRAVEIDPNDAMAHNNLAVAYEANGDFEKARKEYLEALKLDRSNQYIQKNYSRFVEFLSRNRRRQTKEGELALKEASAATTAAVAQKGAPPPGAPAAAEPAKPPETPASAAPESVPQPKPEPATPPPPIAPPTAANPNPTPPPQPPSGATP